MEPDSVVEIRDVVKRFGRGAPALDRLNGMIRAGKITGLVGPDGAGKTTLIRLMTGLMLPDSGSVAVLGYDTKRDSASIQSAIGYMPQKFGLYEDLSIRENLNLYADLQGIPGRERKDIFERLLAFTGLAPFTARLSGKLSGGMKQKLGLACALMKRPRLLLLDEPGVGVDPVSRRELWKMVSELIEDGVSVVWSTAYLDEAEACDHVLLLNAGKMLFSGPPGELTARVKDRVFRVSGELGRKRATLTRFLDAPNVLDGTVQGDAIRLVMRPGTVPAGLPEGAAHSPATPRFEDAFIDLLGGGPGGRSALADANHTIEDSGSRPVIEAAGLTKRFGEFTAAGDITFTVGRGEIFGLLGPNGAGKSTTFKMLCGLLKPTAGSGNVGGFDLRLDGGNARNRLGYMAQKFSLYGDLGVAQNLAFFAGAYGLGRAARRERVELMMKIFGFETYGKQSAKDLPLGLKQRLALACAVLHQPEALFLDEPTSGVDPVTRREFWTHINGLVEKGVSVLVTTHFMDEAEYCDRIALVYRGRIIALGTPDDLKEKAKGPALPSPTMEDAFIALLERHDEQRDAERNPS